MTHSLSRRTLTTAVSLSLCAGLLGLVVGFGAGAWWGPPRANKENTPHAV